MYTTLEPQEQTLTVTSDDGQFCFYWACLDGKMGKNVQVIDVSNTWSVKTYTLATIPVWDEETSGYTVEPNFKGLIKVVSKWLADFNSQSDLN